MSIKNISLGTISGGAATEGLRFTTSTNATPIVLTMVAGHGLKVGDRVAVSGVTGNTGANGSWNVSAIGATTATLEGSVGTGAHGGTVLMRALMDKTPFMQRHAALAIVAPQSSYDGTLLVEGSSDNTTFADAKKSVALGAGPYAPLCFPFEVDLSAYMRFRSSAAGTAGVATASIAA